MKRQAIKAGASVATITAVYVLGYYFGARDAYDDVRPVLATYVQRVRARDRWISQLSEDLMSAREEFAGARNGGISDGITPT